jgi:ABC-2 type transport system permease protein
MVEDFQGFQGINNFLIFPLFFLSGALYPLTSAPGWLKTLGYINPLSYAVDSLRWALINQHHFSLWLDFFAMAITLVIALAFAVNRFNRIQA